MLSRRRPTALRSGPRLSGARERLGGRAFGNPTSCAECEGNNITYRPERKKCELYITLLLVVTGDMFFFFSFFVNSLWTYKVNLSVYFS